MPVLFRTSRPPISFKSEVISLAFLVRSIFFIATYIIPVIICVFYFFDNTQSSFDDEMPIVTPGSVLYFSILAFNNTEDVSVEFPTSPLDTDVTMSALPVFDSSGKTTQFKLEFSYKIPTFVSGGKTPPSPFSFYGFNMIFNYTVQLSRFAKSVNQGFGVFTVNSKNSFDSISAVGEIKLQQTEPVGFRSELPNADIIYNNLNINELFNAQMNTSSTYYVDWITTVTSLQPRNISGELLDPDYLQTHLNVNLRVNVNNIRIIYSIPLVSIIENIILKFLSTFILCNIIFGFIQDVVFTRGYINTFRFRHYEPTKVGRYRN